VAELQALHHRAQSENENLRDLLSRLQNENLALKQESFTFSVPTTIPTEPQEQLPASTSIIPAVQDSQLDLTGSEMATPASLSNLGGSSPPRPSLSPSTVEAFNWSALQPIDPAILDDSPQITATDGAMSMDFGFGGQSSLPFTTIASDPQFMTFADTYDPPPAQYQVFGNDLFDFDMMHGLESWSQPQPDGSLSIQESSYLDSLFGVPSLPSRHNSQSSSLSPVSHTSLPSMTSTSSPASTFSMPNSSGSTTSEVDDHDQEGCPRNKEEALRRMKMAGPSPFVDTPLPPTLQRKVDAALNTMVGCKGSHMPMVEMSDKNVEVFSAWRRIMSDPNVNIQV
jgi:AP-1-like transcription factor